MTYKITVESPEIPYLQEIIKSAQTAIEESRIVKEDYFAIFEVQKTGCMMFVAYFSEAQTMEIYGRQELNKIAVGIKKVMQARNKDASRLTSNELIFDIEAMSETEGVPSDFLGILNEFCIRAGLQL